MFSVGCYVGVFAAQQEDDVITAYEFDSSLAHCDLDNDTVTKVFGRDSQGRVRSLGTVSKTAIKHSAPYKRASKDRNECNTHLEIERKNYGPVGVFMINFHRTQKGGVWTRHVKNQQL